MRALTVDEIRSIAGGLRMHAMTTTLSEIHVHPPVPPPPPPPPPPIPPPPPPPPPYGGGGGGSTGIFTASVLDITKHSALLQSEVNTLSSQGWSFVFAQDPLAAPGASSTDAAHKHIDIAPKYASNPNAAVGQLMHEVYHALHPIDYHPEDYSTLSSYLTAVMNNEGGAQTNAIQVSKQLAVNGVSVALPGNPTDAAAERVIYSEDVQIGASSAQIAHDEGQYMRNVSLGSQTYQQWWTSKYNIAHPK